MTKMIWTSVIFLTLGYASHAFAQGFVPIAPIPGLTDGGAANSNNFADFFNNLYKYLIGIAAVIAVIQITWSGIDIAMNRDNVSTMLDEKGKIYNAVLGLVLVLSPALVFAIINPNILKLSLNLPPIAATPNTPTQSNTQQALPDQQLNRVVEQPTAGQSSSCTASGRRFTCSFVGILVSGGVCTQRGIAESADGSCTAITDKCICIK